MNKNLRKAIIAGNWKMNKTRPEAKALLEAIKPLVANAEGKIEVIACVPFTNLETAINTTAGSNVKIGAENVHFEKSGAFTGEISADMLTELGVEYVVIGHSERRAYYHEDYEILKNKVELALANGLKVIFCIGEVKEEREAGKQNEVVKAQLEGSVFHLSAEAWKNIVLAYEPVWAIGTGLTATPAQAQDMHAYLRGLVAKQYGAQAAEDTTILYGGSCNEKNAAELFACPDIDGGLIGGAALVAEKFEAIIAAR